MNCPVVKLTLNGSFLRTLCRWRRMMPSWWVIPFSFFSLFQETTQSKKENYRNPCWTSCFVAWLHGHMLFSVCFRTYLLNCFVNSWRTISSEPIRNWKFSTLLSSGLKTAVNRKTKRKRWESPRFCFPSGFWSELKLSVFQAIDYMVTILAVVFLVRFWSWLDTGWCRLRRWRQFTVTPGCCRRPAGQCCR